MDFRHYLYQHIRLDTNEVFYIGVGSKSEKSRKSYKREYSRAHTKCSRNDFWHNIINKTDYKVEILMESDEYNTVKKVEVALIALYGRRDLGKGNLVNLTDGGDGSVNTIVTKETKARLSESHKGYKHTNEAKLRISTTKTGRLYTPEEILNYKTPVPKGQNPSRTILLDYQTGVYYNSISEASRVYGISDSFLSCMLSGKKRNSTSLVYANSDEKGTHLVIPEIRPYMPFIVTDEYRQNLSNKLRGKNLREKNGSAKKVINIITDKLYNCAKDACEESGYKYPYFTQMISPTSKSTNKTPFEYYDEQKHKHLLK